jgi:hypothetical protein
MIDIMDELVITETKAYSFPEPGAAEIAMVRKAESELLAIR